MKQGPSPRLIGIFIVGAVVLTVTLVLAVSSGSFFAKRYPFVVFFQQSVAGLDPGAPVRFMGVRVGAVRAVTLNIGTSQQRALDDVRIPVIIEIDEKLLAQEGITGLALQDSALIREWIAQGFRAEIAVESFVTGKKFISLVVRPGSLVELVGDPGLPYLELPAMRGGVIEELETEVRRALAALVRLDVDTVLVTMMNTMNNIDRFVTADATLSAASLGTTLVQVDSTLAAMRQLAMVMEAGIAPVQRDIAGAAADASSSAAELRTTLAAFRAIADPQSPMLVRLEHALTRLGAAGYAMETLAEYLARNPGALVRGKPATERN
jgi:paraquat-inducible protein B